MHREFSDIVTTEAELREILGQPGKLASNKVISVMDEHVQKFIEKSPFIVIASADASGSMDISPKGDPPGFVQVLDEKTLAIPDRIGNNLADTFSNILQNDHVSLLFIVPMRSETLRIVGRAKIVRDAWLREQMTHQGKVPHFAIVVTVEQAFLHCGKCMIRSSMWDAEAWQSIDDMASMAQMMIAHTQLKLDLERLEEAVVDEYKNELY